MDTASTTCLGIIAGAGSGTVYQPVKPPPLLGFFGKSEAYEGGGGYLAFGSNRSEPTAWTGPAAPQKSKNRNFRFLPVFAFFFFGARLRRAIFSQNSLIFPHFFAPARLRRPHFPNFFLGTPAAPPRFSHFFLGAPAAPPIFLHFSYAPARDPGKFPIFSPARAYEGGVL